ncbi:putative receptor-like protein kinase At4g00960 isoform X2 [Quercus lobata]|uniref:Cysteine-rich receptor-like protein kinase 29 n=1 Tax=Quercus lobata TaxID=97700 RepID=A0A7N2LUK7_QUELO|nr:putative receptor-like protein kinase At4g00960 isoform X2 [Quercus lobata]
MAMVSSRILFFLSAILMLIVHAMGQLAYSQSYNCSNSYGNYTSNSIYETNLNQLLSSLYSNTTIDFGFYKSSYGQNSDQVYGIGLCRGDVTPDDCRECLKNSSSLLTQLCPNQKEAIVRCVHCMLRYSNSSIFGIMETNPGYHILNLENVSANYVAQFNDDLNILLNNLTNEAAAGGSLRKYAAGSAIATDFMRLYALVQCTPDLSEQDCNNCLLAAIAYVPQCCAGKVGGSVLLPSCNIRFQVYSFFNSTAAPPSTNATTSPPSTNTTTSKVNGSNTSQTVIIIVVASVAFVVLTISICICVYLRVRRPREKEEKVDDEFRSVESLQFDFSTIRVATNDFSEANKLGQGGFGVVYKGMLYNGEEIAAKRLSTNSGQGDLEFTNEVLLVAKLQHRNLVRLLGFCMERNERLLIYEFVPNTSLDHFLFDPINHVHLNWENRYKIIGGIARGLLYLHEDSRLRIIHRDLKASNILLDEEMNPKISDFGMAKLFLLDQTQANTSRIVGTYGYMAPEYAMHGQFSVKSDVFSFGVLVLEIVSGQRNNCFRNGENVEDLLSYAWKNWREGTASHIIDPTLRHNPITEIMRCIHIGLLCIQESVTDRPTMAMIVLMLNSYSITPPVPSQPAFFMHKNIESDISKSDHSKGSYVQLSANEDTITELDPR